MALVISDPKVFRDYVKRVKIKGYSLGDKNLHNTGMQGEGGVGVLNNAIWRRGVAALCRLCRILPPYTPTPTPLDPYSPTISYNRMLIGKYWWDPPHPFFHPLRVLEFIYRTYVRKTVRTPYICVYIYRICSRPLTNAFWLISFLCYYIYVVEKGDNAPLFMYFFPFFYCRALLEFNIILICTLKSGMTNLYIRVRLD